MSEALSGLSVVNPAAWWALLALCIPLIIHLFSKSRGRLVRIGHIDLIRQARKLQVTELKLTQWLLLFLRLAIITLACLILAGLATAGLNSSNANTIYLTANWLSNANTADLTELLNDADQAAESRIFLLQHGFPTIDREQIETDRQRQGSDMPGLNNPWALLSERLSLEHHRGKVSVYITDYMLQFGSYKPNLPRHVDWHIAHPDKAPVLDRRPVRATIVFAPDRAEDASRLDTVLSILKEHRMPELTWESVELSRLPKAPGNIDWAILLGNSIFEPEIIEKLNSPAVIFADATASDSDSDTQFIDLPFYPFTRFRLDQFSLPALHDREKVMLTTATGSPLLQESHYGQTRLIQFYSRFDPRWNSLTQQAEFPELFLQLMSGSEEERLRYANARLSELSLQAHSNDATSDIPLPHRSLTGLLAALLALFWMIERWLSERKPREKR